MNTPGQTHNEQTLRPVEAVEADLAKAQFLVPDEQREYRQSVLTTDRDAAYTMLKVAIDQEPTINHMVLKERVLQLLDTIYGKTPTT